MRIPFLLVSWMINDDLYFKIYYYKILWTFGTHQVGVLFLSPSPLGHSALLSRYSFISRWVFIDNPVKFIHHCTKYLYIQSTTVYVPSSELGLPLPLSRKQALPPGPNVGGGGGAHRPGGMGVGGYPLPRRG